MTETNATTTGTLFHLLLRLENPGGYHAHGPWLKGVQALDFRRRHRLGDGNVVPHARSFNGTRLARLVPLPEEVARRLLKPDQNEREVEIPVDLLRDGELALGWSNGRYDAPRDDKDEPLLGLAEIGLDRALELVAAVEERDRERDRQHEEKKLREEAGRLARRVAALEETNEFHLRRIAELEDLVAQLRGDEDEDAAGDDDA
jgi:hypothetical protein